jgi:N6-L-threonylcarbamoyladenine synthase/N6-L-threonylcarbamoyladenine synthase/protein kinase Bud32
MISIGIEGTAHSIAIGVVENNDDTCIVLSNIIKTYYPKTGGIHPRQAANHHADHVADVIKSSLEKAHVSIRDIDLISFSQGPGLGPCLRTAATAARTLSLRLNKPIMGVNHCVAHLEIGRGTIHRCADPVLLYTSGANTQVIAFAEGKYRVFGETLDIGIGNCLDKFGRYLNFIGNCLDKFGRYLNFPFPSGPIIEKYARRGKNYLRLPYSVKGMDLAFSGLLTVAQQYHQDGFSLEDICYSIQENCFAMLTEVTERAMAQMEKHEVLLGGGVAANMRLREMIEMMAKDRDAVCFVPRKDLCIDNGAMIAWLGLIMYQSGLRMCLEDTVINQRFRTDMVDVTWRE